MSQGVIKVYSKKGHEVIPIDNIEIIEASGAYSTLHLKNKTTFLVSKTLKKISSELGSHPFIRPNHSFLVNLSCIKNYSRSAMGFSILMQGGTEISISRRKKASLASMIS